MPRIVQAVAFFALLAVGYLAVAPVRGGAELLGVLLSGAIIAATIVYVLPWVFGLETRPARDKRT
ncbi:hypothetical protein HUG10_15205 [Halorarum halophilum]|uniref:Uncharacterized protein n=1 Tax=Halorarum halophilum TaxID=2743090 RepID=A0A7D5GMU2_9EURY|nr:hypothetical protein [Halobaculum halophilum]QLG28804.1 hypothetical protein HUG10_15205 [Halobaculum halophilum]